MAKQNNIERLKKVVSKRYPGAIASKDNFNKWFIYWNERDLLDEFFLPHTDTEHQAWEFGALTARTIQNINRTHPDKIIMEIEEIKHLRLGKRRRRSLEKKNEEKISDDQKEFHKLNDDFSVF